MSRLDMLLIGAATGFLGYLAYQAFKPRYYEAIEIDRDFHIEGDAYLDDLVERLQRAINARPA